MHDKKLTTKYCCSSRSAFLRNRIRRAGLRRDQHFVEHFNRTTRKTRLRRKNTTPRLLNTTCVAHEQIVDSLRGSRRSLFGENITKHDIIIEFKIMNEILTCQFNLINLHCLRKNVPHQRRQPSAIHDHVAADGSVPWVSDAPNESAWAVRSLHDCRGSNGP